MDGRFYDNADAFFKILEKHSLANRMFTDEEFYACAESIIDPNDDIDDLEELGPVTW